MWTYICHIDVTSIRFVDVSCKKNNEFSDKMSKMYAILVSFLNLVSVLNKIRDVRYRI